MHIDALIERAHRDEATAAELTELADWRALTEENERHYRDVLRILAATGALRAELTAAPAPPSYAALLRWRNVQAPGRAGAGAATQQAGEVRRGWRVLAPWAVAAAAVVMLVVNTVGRSDGGEPASLLHAEFITGPGEIATVQLGDGSVVRLAPDSRLRLGEARDERVVSLDGRAFFSVAPQHGRPFSVVTAAGTARVLGTRFDLRANEQELELVVVEGRVALDAPQNSVVVAAGQASAVTNGVAAEPNAIDDGSQVLRWAGRFLVFQNTPLRDAAREIEAMYGVRIRIPDPSLREQTVTAMFTGQDLEAVLAVICEIVNAQCVRRADEVTVSPR